MTFKGVQKIDEVSHDTSGVSAIDTSDNALLSVLRRLKTTNSRIEIRQLTDQLERIIFHKQFAH